MATSPVSRGCGPRWTAAGDGLRAKGLLALRSVLGQTRAQPGYRRLADELPRLRAQLDQASSITLGINLDGQLRPESATIVSVNASRFAGKSSLLDRLFGERAAPDAVRGITALYKADERQQHRPEHELFRDLDRLMERVAAPVADALSSYTHVHGTGWRGWSRSWPSTSAPPGWRIACKLPACRSAAPRSRRPASGCADRGDLQP